VVKTLNFGKVSYWIGRAGVQANKVIVPMNFLMLVYLTVQEQAWVLVLLPFVFCVGMLGLWFDNKKVIESELEYWFSRTPGFRRMEEKLDKLLEDKC